MERAFATQGKAKQGALVVRAAIFMLCCRCVPMISLNVMELICIVWFRSHSHRLLLELKFRFRGLREMSHYAYLRELRVAKRFGFAMRAFRI